jgi:hypothetical protein
MLIIFLNRELEDIGVNVCSSLDKLQMNRIRQIKFKWRRDSLKPTPKWFIRLFYYMISRKGIK